jgi:hypothetical protein
MNHTGKMLPDPDYSVSRKSSERPRKQEERVTDQTEETGDFFLPSNGKLMHVFLCNKTSDVRIMGKPRHLNAKVLSPHFVSATNNISTMILHRWQFGVRR